MAAFEVVALFGGGGAACVFGGAPLDLLRGFAAAFEVVALFGTTGGALGSFGGGAFVVVAGAAGAACTFGEWRLRGRGFGTAAGAAKSGFASVDTWAAGGGMGRRWEGSWCRRSGIAGFQSAALACLCASFSAAAACSSFFAFARPRHGCGQV